MAPFQSISTKMKYSQNIPTQNKKRKASISFTKTNFLGEK
jgi:hypothetical protein